MQASFTIHSLSLVPATNGWYRYLVEQGFSHPCGLSVVGVGTQITITVETSQYVALYQVYLRSEGIDYK